MGQQMWMRPVQAEQARPAVHLGSSAARRAEEKTTPAEAEKWLATPGLPVGAGRTARPWVEAGRAVGRAGRTSAGRRAGARLQVASPAHGRVRAWGTSRFVAANTVHVSGAAGVVAGNDCRLRSVDHYHVNRVSVSFAPLLRDGAAKAALRALLLAPEDSAAIGRLQRHARRLAGAGSGGGTTEVAVAARPAVSTSIVSCDAVQVGNGSTMTATTHHIVRDSELPIVDLLAGNANLVRLFAHALTADESGPERAAFLAKLRLVAGTVDDLAVLDHATGLDAGNSRIVGFFGPTVVRGAAAAMIGSNNELEATMRLDRPGVGRRDLVSDLAKLRRQLRVGAGVQEASA
jgi:hypothetical protein